MGIKSIIRNYFNKGNVCVTGLRGSGKDMLIGNVIARRKLDYISNINYGYNYNKLDFEKLNCGNNSYNDFINGTTKKYIFPYKDDTDIYISDVGIYFPSQYCSELNKQYKNIPTFMALSRHLGNCNVHFNVQNLNRAWDKLREQSDIYITCVFCYVFFKGRFVLQQIRIYDKYESCVNRVKPFKMKTSLFDRNISKTQIKLAKEQYTCTHGEIRTKMLFYRNKAKYNTRYFKELLERSPV